MFVNYMLPFLNYRVRPWPSVTWGPIQIFCTPVFAALKFFQLVWIGCSVPHVVCVGFDWILDDLGWTVTWWPWVCDVMQLGNSIDYLEIQWHLGLWQTSYWAGTFHVDMWWWSHDVYVTISVVTIRVMTNSIPWLASIYMVTHVTSYWCIFIWQSADVRTGSVVAKLIDRWDRVFRLPSVTSLTKNILDRSPRARCHFR